jgi:hypothetical protein
VQEEAVDVDQRSAPAGAQLAGQFRKFGIGFVVEQGDARHVSSCRLDAADRADSDRDNVSVSRFRLVALL